MVTPGSIYTLLAAHKPLIFAGAGSVLCSLTNLVPESLGVGAILPLDDPDYDVTDTLRGLPSFTGVSYDPETGMIISADQAEIAISQEDVASLGRPIKGWTGKLRNFDGSELAFRVLDVMQDRTIGCYRIRLEVQKPASQGRRIYREGGGGV